jgi:shikimate dehydrogenase
VNRQALFAGLLGARIHHSLSPRMHTQWFTELSIGATYSLFSEPTSISARATVERLLATPGFLGLNITAPYKALLLDDPRFHQSAHVVRTGAANTLYRNAQGGWALENTDVFGIAASVERLCGPALVNSPEPEIRWKVVCLGAGGAARALPEALSLQPLGSKVNTPVLFLCRDPAKSRLSGASSQNPKAFASLHFDEAAEALAVEKHLLVVNTLPLGLPGSSTPENPYARAVLKLLHGKRLCYFDMLYLPSDGMACAAELGVPALNGALMLQEQGRRSFELWVNVRPLSNPITPTI